MPQKLDWADRHLFVASRGGEQFVKTHVQNMASYERALEQLSARNLSVAKRELRSRLTEMKRQCKLHDRSAGLWEYLRGNPTLNAYRARIAELEDELARFNVSDPRTTVHGRTVTKREILAVIAKSYEDVCKKNGEFRSWSQFVRNGPPAKPVAIMFCSTDIARVFLSTGKRNLAKLAKAVNEELPYVVSVPWNQWDVCLFGRDVWKLKGSEIEYKPGDLKLLLLDRSNRGQQKIESLRRRFEGKSGRKLDPLREPIPESVRIYVWRRDEGKCVVCGSQDRLEFDHIIPVTKGGGNTNRNIQLLCERCNRSKQDRI